MCVCVCVWVCIGVYGYMRVCGVTVQLSRAYVKRMACWPLEYIAWFLFELIVCANHEFPLFNYSLDGTPRVHGHSRVYAP